MKSKKRKLDAHMTVFARHRIRRSTAATHMLEAKWLLANHPNTRGEIDFERVEQDDSNSSILVQTPGIGEFWFEKDDLFVDGKDLEPNSFT
jgi:hypothetical protein